jgi:hypothetical protein
MRLDLTLEMERLQAVIQENSKKKYGTSALPCQGKRGEDPSLSKRLKPFSETDSFRCKEK